MELGAPGLGVGGIAKVDRDNVPGIAHRFSATVPMT